MRLTAYLMTALYMEWVGAQTREYAPLFVYQLCKVPPQEPRSSPAALEAVERAALSGGRDDLAAALQIVAGSDSALQVPPVARDGVAVPEGGVLEQSLLGGEVDVDQPEALAEA